MPKKGSKRTPANAAQKARPVSKKKSSQAPAKKSGAKKSGAAKKKSAAKKKKAATRKAAKTKAAKKSGAAKKKSAAKKKKKKKKKKKSVTPAGVASLVGRQAPEGAHPELGSQSTETTSGTPTIAGAAGKLRELALLLELSDANPFKVRAYENGARALDGLAGELAELLQSGELKRTPGIGKSMYESLAEYAKTGTMTKYEEVRADFPPGVLALLRVPGLGPKKAAIAYRELGVDSPERLRAACTDGSLAALSGFGAKTAENLLRALEHLRKRGGHERFLLPEAELAARQVAALLDELPGVTRHAIAGSLRRRAPTVHDIDVLVAADPEHSASIHAAFVTQPGVGSIIAQGETKSSIRFDNGLQVDLRVVAASTFPFAWQYFTGSKEHNIVMRQRAIKRGLRLNEYALAPPDGAPIAAADEAHVYRALGLEWIPPELRENLGEFAAAEYGTLPALIEESDLTGVFHVHTEASDGTLTLEAIVAEALARGYAYVGITDHGPGAAYADGVSVETLRAQGRAIETLNRQLAGRLRLLKGVEAEILADGALDLSDEVLAELDFVLAACHQELGADEATTTRRLIRAIEHPAVTMLAHPTSRLLGAHDGAPLDIDAVLLACAQHGVAVECNGNPHRLDLDWRALRRAKEFGVPVALNPGAHHRHSFDHVRYAVGLARKGWLEAADVFNARSLDELLAPPF